MKVPENVLRATFEEYEKQGGSIRKTANVMRSSRSTIRRRLAKAEGDLGLVHSKPLASGRIAKRETFKRSLPKGHEVYRYILTAAQNNTYAHGKFWRNLISLSEWYGNCEILVSQFTYNKSSYGEKSTKPGRGPTEDDVAELWFDGRLEGYFCNDSVELAPSLVFCGESNTLPTATRPLSGYKTYTKKKSGIFPHAKIAMESVPAMQEHGAKFNYTTGACTQINYIQKKAGLKAEFHHSYGACLVEVNSRGEWWVRQLNAEDDGSFYDLNIYVKDEEIIDGCRVEGINWGDIHAYQMDPMVREVNWGHQGMLDTLMPSYQFMHDTVDFFPRNHHSLKDSHAMFKRFAEKQDSVEEEFDLVSEFLNEESQREWCQTVVVDSNHDNAFIRWLREADYRTDPTNAVFFLQSQLAMYQAIERGEDEFHLTEDTLRRKGLFSDIQFLRPGQSFVIAGSIECGMHGDKGPNGARGTPLNLSNMGTRANTGHTHSAGILDGLYTAGTCSVIPVDFSKDAPSSWSQSHIITYLNGKRTIVTLYNGKWRA